MWKPEVGQKYLCVCNDRKLYVQFGELVEVVTDNYPLDTITLLNKRNGKKFAWSYKEYPNDFKIAERTTEHGHFTSYPSENTPSSHVKPPLGLQPQSVHDNLRVQHILAAMQRYVAANKAIPNEWLEELIDKIELNHE